MTRAAEFVIDVAADGAAAKERKTVQRVAAVAPQVLALWRTADDEDVEITARRRDRHGMDARPSVGSHRRQVDKRELPEQPFTEGRELR